MKYYYMLVILVLGVPIHLFAQHNINGQVLSAIDSVPLRGATIQIGDTLKALSDDDGRFNFNHFTNAAKLRFTLVGYKPLTASSLSEAEKYYLIPSETLLDEVMVNKIGRAQV